LAWINSSFSKGFKYKRDQKREWRRKEGEERRALRRGNVGGKFRFLATMAMVALGKNGKAALSDKCGVLH